MGIITPFADAASPIYANSGYLLAEDYWRLGAIFGAFPYLVSYHRRAFGITPIGEVALSQP
jgi:di/tricarboxylate transporter